MAVMLKRRTLALVGVSAALLVNVACDTGPSVSIQNFKFVPASVTQNLEVQPPAEQDDEVNWLNESDGAHNVKNTTFPDPIFASATLAPGDIFEARLHQAGKYRYICTFHPKKMKGTVNAPVSISFSGTGPDVGDVVFVDWSDSDIPTGFNMDVQIKRNKRDWKSFVKDAVDATSGTDWAPAKAGNFKFRARLQHTATGKATPFSAPASITIHPAP